ncbi:MAG: MFS transporter [Nanobdellota archaeon]
MYRANIWKFYVLKVLSSLELTISIFVLFMLSNGLNMTQVMVLETIYVVVMILLEVPSGSFADVFGRRLSVSLSILFGAVAFLIFGLGSSFIVYLIAQLMLGISVALESGADKALLYDSLRHEGMTGRYSRIQGRANSIALITWGTTALVSGLLATFFGYRLLFYLTAIIFFLAFIFSYTLKEPPVHEHVSSGNYLRLLRKGLSFTYRHRIVRDLIIYYGLFAALGHLTWFLIQPYYKGSGLPEYIIGVATFVYFMTASMGNFFAEPFLKIRKLYIYLIVIASLGFIGIYFTGPIIAFVMIGLMSFTCGVRDVFVAVGINEHTSSVVRSTVLSVQNLAKSLMYGLFAPLIGYLTDIFTPAAAFLMMGIVLSVFAVVFILSQARGSADLT